MDVFFIHKLCRVKKNNQKTTIRLIFIHIAYTMLKTPFTFIHKNPFHRQHKTLINHSPPKYTNFIKAHAQNTTPSIE